MACAGVFLLAPQRAESDVRLRIFLLMIFGTAGTLTRYALQGLIQYHSESSFPIGTLFVNLIGCFLLGGIGQFGLDHISFPPEWRVAITMGFFGAFTTFSSFSWETVHMFEDGDWIQATVYVSASVLGGLLLVRTGMRLAKMV